MCYGNEARRPLTLPGAMLINRDLRVRGFDLRAWLARTPGSELEEVRARVLGLSADGLQMKLLIAREPFVDFEYALKRSLQTTERKVVMVMPQ